MRKESTPLDALFLKALIAFIFGLSGCAVSLIFIIFWQAGEAFLTLPVFILIAAVGYEGARWAPASVHTRKINTRVIRVMEIWFQWGPEWWRIKQQTQTSIIRSRNYDESTMGDLVEACERHIENLPGPVADAMKRLRGK